MRDWWYKKAETMFYPNPDLPKLEKIIDELVLATPKSNEEVVNLRSVLKEYSNTLIDTMTLQTSGSTATNIVNSAFSTLKINVHNDLKLSGDVKGRSWSVIDDNQTK